jgi:hypothetical protein
VVYKKKLENEIDIKSPQDIGGLKSDAYLSLNPQGKMPLLVLPDGTAIAESEARLPCPIAPTAALMLFPMCR